MYSKSNKRNIKENFLIAIQVEGQFVTVICYLCPTKQTGVMYRLSSRFIFPVHISARVDDTCRKDSKALVCVIKPMFIWQALSPRFDNARL